MIAEEIIHRMHWSAAWYANPGPFFRLPFGPRWHVGVWTGPDGDLVCVKGCKTAEEAVRHLSPSGWTILHATVLAWLKARRLARQQFVAVRAVDDQVLADRTSRGR